MKNINSFMVVCILALVSACSSGDDSSSAGSAGSAGSSDQAGASSEGGSSAKQTEKAGGTSNKGDASSSTGGVSIIVDNFGGSAGTSSTSTSSSTGGISTSSSNTSVSTGGVAPIGGSSSTAGSTSVGGSSSVANPSPAVGVTPGAYVKSSTDIVCPVKLTYVGGKNVSFFGASNPDKTKLTWGIICTEVECSLSDDVCVCNTNIPKGFWFVSNVSIRNSSMWAVGEKGDKSLCPDDYNVTTGVCNGMQGVVLYGDYYIGSHLCVIGDVVKNPQKTGDNFLTQIDC